MTTALYSGNLGLGHDLETIVRAVSKLNGRVALTVHLVGTGKARPLLEELVRQLGLANVEFHLPVPLQSLPVLLRKGDIHLVSQRDGTQGLIVPSKIYGILAIGRPTVFIGPKDSEVSTIIRESNSGITVRPGDVHGTAKAILDLALNKKLRMTMGMRARKYYQDHLGQEKSVARIVRAIEGVVESVPAAQILTSSTVTSEDKERRDHAPIPVQDIPQSHLGSDRVSEHR